MHLRELFLTYSAQTSPFPLLLEIDRTEGVWMFASDGKRTLDLISGIGVSVLGHRHPAVIAAVQSQLDRYLHTMVYGEMVLEPSTRLAALLCAHLPAPLDKVYLVNSGAEAAEGAMKLAKRFTGRPEIISCKYAYHGSTQGAASLMWPTTFTQAFHPLLPGIRHIDFNCLHCLSQINTRTAAVIVETVQAEWGVRTPAPGYLQALRKRCDETGTLLIFDEIQVGFGRTGTLFAFQQYQVRPDILLLAKGMGGGMPIGAFIAPTEIMQTLSERPILGHITTFGGHPVNSAAALATLETLLNTSLMDEVKNKETLFRNLLKHPKILDLRSAGLLMAVELADFALVQKTITYCIRKGVLIDWFLFNDRALRIAPPLIIQEEEIRWACQIILEALDQA